MCNWHHLVSQLSVVEKNYMHVIAVVLLLLGQIVLDIARILLMKTFVYL